MELAGGSDGPHTQRTARLACVISFSPWQRRRDPPYRDEDTHSGMWQLVWDYFLLALSAGRPTQDCLHFMRHPRTRGRGPAEHLNVQQTSIINVVTGFEAGPTETPQTSLPRRQRALTLPRCEIKLRTCESVYLVRMHSADSQTCSIYASEPQRQSGRS